MNLTKTNQQKKMSSREIAALVEKRHDNVKRTIESLASQGVIQLPQIEEVKNHKLQSVLEYKIIERDTYVIVAQLSPEFTGRLVDRWQELEVQQQNVLPNFQDAAEMARLWADQYEAQQQAQLLIEQQTTLIEEQTPKVDFYDTYMSSMGNHTFDEVAKILYLGKNTLLKAMRDDGVLFKKKSYNLPIQRYVDSGWFEVKLTPYVTGSFSTTSYKTLVTPKGLREIQKRWGVSKDTLMQVCSDQELLDYLFNQ